MAYLETKACYSDVSALMSVVAMTLAPVGVRIRAVWSLQAWIKAAHFCLTLWLMPYLRWSLPRRQYELWWPAGWSGSTPAYWKKIVDLCWFCSQSLWMFRGCFESPNQWIPGLSHLNSKWNEDWFIISTVSEVSVIIKLGWSSFNLLILDQRGRPDDESATSLFVASKLVIGSALNNNQSEEPIVRQQLHYIFVPFPTINPES